MARLKDVLRLLGLARVPFIKAQACVVCGLRESLAEAGHI